jgi:hypothetical protein
MAVFGAEQIQESQITSRYFDKYMVAVNIGGIISTSAIPYIQNREGSHYLTGYIVAAAMLFIATLLFIIGRRYYIYVPPYNTAVANCIPVVINAFQSWYKYKQNRRSVDKKHTTSSLNLMNAAYSPNESEESIRIDERPSTFLDFAKVPHGKFPDRPVDDIKSLRGALIVFTILIPYWLVYDQVK